MANPNTEKADPTLTKLRMDKLDPVATKLNTLIAEENLANERNETLDPRLISSKRLICDARLLRRPRFDTENEEPSREKERMLTAEPRPWNPRIEQ
jgi:hypothetical protein